MTDEAYQLDIAGIAANADGRCSDGTQPRHWVGVHFKCCGVYVRIYRDEAATAYRGTCPHCGKPVSLRVGKEGINARFFTAE